MRLKECPRLKIISPILRAINLHIHLANEEDKQFDAPQPAFLQRELQSRRPTSCGNQHGFA